MHQFSPKALFRPGWHITLSKSFTCYTIDACCLFILNVAVCTWPSVQFSSVGQSCLTLCDPVDGSTPVFPVHHQLPEPTQTHVHHVGDAIQPSHPLSSPSPPAFKLSHNIRVFSNELVLHIRWPKYWSFSFSISLSSEFSGLISFRIDWLDLLAVPSIMQDVPCRSRAEVVITKNTKSNPQT